MFCCGTDIVLELIAATYYEEKCIDKEVTKQVLRRESDQHINVEDIVRLPLKLPFPCLTLKSSQNNEPTSTRITGPDGNENPIIWGEDHLCGRSISTYPMITVNKGTEHESTHRDGDPICDRFLVEMLPQRTIAVVADGCNWGEKPRRAAEKASNSFADYLLKHQEEATTTHYVARLITRAFSIAHHSILEGYSDLWDVGTTTLLGGILVQLEKPLLEDRDGVIVSCKWAFIWGSVGDCKGFHYSASQNTFRDITSANRLGTASARDCGGRLGPAGTEGLPDLRNFRIDLTPCEEDDILILVSDGVHDNLEPLQIGLSPLEVAYPDDIPWESIDPQRRAEIAASYSIFLLSNLIHADDNGVPKEPYYLPEHPEWKQWTIPPLEVFANEQEKEDEALNTPATTCYKIVQRLMNHCLATNRNAATFMQDNPTKKLPKNYQLYPGKMDHTTCLCLRVRKNEKLRELRKSKEDVSTSVGKKKRVKRKLSCSLGGHLSHRDNERPQSIVIYPSLEEADVGKTLIISKRTSSIEPRKDKTKSKKALVPTLRRSRSLESIPIVASAKKETKKKKAVSKPPPSAL